MISAQISVVANNEEELFARLTEITNQIARGYSSGSATAKTESFKFLVKESAAGSTAMLPRITGETAEVASATATSAPVAEGEAEEEVRDEAGVLPVASASLS